MQVFKEMCHDSNGYFRFNFASLSLCHISLEVTSKYQYHNF